MVEAVLQAVSTVLMVIALAGWTGQGVVFFVRGVSWLWSKGVERWR